MALHWLCWQFITPAQTNDRLAAATSNTAARCAGNHNEQQVRAHVLITPAAPLFQHRSLPPPPVLDDGEAVVASEQRVRRLGTLVQLRRSYENVLYAELLLSQTSPIYQPLTAGPWAYGDVV